MGVSLFAVMFLMLFLYRRLIGRASYATISGKAFRPRRDGHRAPALAALRRVRCFYVLLAVVAAA